MYISRKIVKIFVVTNVRNSKSSTNLASLSKHRSLLKFSGERMVGLNKVRDTEEGREMWFTVRAKTGERLHTRYTDFSLSKNFFAHHWGYSDISWNLDVKVAM